MASTSSPTTPSWKHDVFLSFRGTDTRYSFTSHLHAALQRNQINAYIDNKLDGGEKLEPALLEKIEDSYISVVIFSKKYADSTFCLRELSKILECMETKGQRLQHLPQLQSSLQVLDASRCTSLTSVEGIFMQGEKDYEAASQEFNFSYCPQLDQSSLTKIIGDARLRIQRMATSLFNQQYFGKPISVRLCIPGSEVPEWFTYKNTGPTAHWHHANTTDQLFGFTLCAVVSFVPRQECQGNFNIKCECHLITKDGTHSDHLESFKYEGEMDWWTEWEGEPIVFIWSIHSHCSFKEASFHFKPLFDVGSTVAVVVRSGVHPLFVEDYIVEPEQPQPKRLKLMGKYILL